MTGSAGLPAFDDVVAAAARIAGTVHRTPVLTCRTLDELVRARLHFKCENFQKVGAFKARGAANAVLSLAAEEAVHGVATHSSGNHGAALAWAAARRGIPAYVVMPRTSKAVKKAAVAGYGAHVVECEPTLAARETKLAEVVASTGAAFVHPYNDPRVIAGQGTAALEFCEQVHGLSAVLAPVGGGGLLSGTALAVQGCCPSATVWGVEPAAADDAYRSLREGRIVPSLDPRTIADGLRTSLGSRTFAIIQQHVRGIVTVSEEAIVAAMRLVWERMKIVIEPSSAVPLAALLEGSLALAGQRVGIILSGGNVDLEELPWLGGR
ncbi:MAG TPA: pyridoxal-phosphate dependent enzyme [Thermoanaerobaculaceae bacterium]|nr:pyridoxal-phosphate dependent enzyme [Thermoanaerobaculaceae bacterium]HRS15783.1 pyridoxal-phosphate dependent enzyme [Thermoanaerobaculaceae bacterium]